VICDLCGKDMRHIGIVELSETMRLVENPIIEVNECSTKGHEGRVQFYRASDDHMRENRKYIKKVQKEIEAEEKV